MGFLDLLSKKYDDLSPLLEAYFARQKYHLKFKSAIPVDLRLRYFLLSYLKRQHQKGMILNSSRHDLLKNSRPSDLNVLRVWARETVRALASP